MTLYKNFQKNTSFLVRYILSHFPARSFQTGLHVGHNHSNKLSYRDFIREKLEQARKTVFVRYPHNPDNVYESCESQGGRIKEVHTFQQGPELNVALIEFTQKDSVGKLLQNTLYFPHPDQMPVESRYLYHTTRFNRQLQRKRGKTRKIIDHTDKKISLSDRELGNCSSVSDQILKLYEEFKLTDFEIRKRFLLCVSLEEIIKQILPHAIVRPFGSSVSGLGRRDCDVDLVLHIADGLDEDCKTERLRGNSFYFMSKRGRDRASLRRTLEHIGGLLKSVHPLFSNFAFILRARVPIISFNHMGLGLNCDLSIDVKSSTHMSELLYTIGCMDDRLGPLVFTVRHWARCNGLTRKDPGGWLSNFMLTTLLVFFLQSRPVPVLPPLQDFCDSISGNQHLTCKTKSLSQKRVGMKNSEELGVLLEEFFRFYGNLDFSSYGLSLTQGQIVNNTEGIPLLICNPFDSEHNVSRNVTTDEIEKFQLSCLESHRMLSSHCNKDSDDKWGLMNILVADIRDIEQPSTIDLQNVFADSVD